MDFVDYITKSFESGRDFLASFLLLDLNNTPDHY
jgi:hypothetical protein